MEMKKCNECGLITNEKVSSCSKCSSENITTIDMLDRDKLIYILCNEDVDVVLSDMRLSKEQKEILKSISKKDFYSKIRHAISIEWYEYIEAAIDACLYTQKHNNN